MDKHLKKWGALLLVLAMALALVACGKSANAKEAEELVAASPTPAQTTAPTAYTHDELAALARETAARAFLLRFYGEYGTIKQKKGAQDAPKNEVIAWPEIMIRCSPCL